MTWFFKNMNLELEKILKDKKVIFFDIGYTLDYPNSGYWFLTKLFFEYAKNKNNLDNILKAQDECMYILDNNHKMNTFEQEHDAFYNFYLTLSEKANLDFSEEQIENLILDHAFNMENFVPYNDSKIVVKELASKYTLGVISDNWPSGIVQLYSMGIKKYFKTITFSNDVGVFKPNELLFLDALNKMNCKAEDAVFIDDLNENLIGASKLGITPILICQDNNTNQNRETEFTKIFSLNELI